LSQDSNYNKEQEWPPKRRATVPAYVISPPSAIIGASVFAYERLNPPPPAAIKKELPDSPNKALTARTREIKNDLLRDARWEAGLAEAEAEKEKWTQVKNNLKNKSPNEKKNEGQAEDRLGFVEEAFEVGIISKPLPPNKPNPSQEELVNSYLAKGEVMRLIDSYCADEHLGVKGRIQLQALSKRRGYFPTEAERQAFVTVRGALTAHGLLEAESLKIQQRDAETRAEEISKMLPFDERLLLGMGASHWTTPEPAPKQEYAPTHEELQSFEDELRKLMSGVVWKTKDPGEAYLPAGEVLEPMTKFIREHGYEIGTNKYSFPSFEFEFGRDGDLVRTFPQSKRPLIDGV
jgi:hypothetical protein